MRVLQLIDSLRPGGAEKMAVTYANALANRIEGSFLCCTRLEGLLKKQLSPEVGYLFLNKTGTFDLKAFLKLKEFVKVNKIDVIHAHGSSFFLGVLVKKAVPGLKLVWHDHFGERANKDLKPGLLRLFSREFDGIITVTSMLKVYAEKNLKCKNVQFIPNFPSGYMKETPFIPLKITDGFKIVHLANLKAPKDHLTLLEAFEKLFKKHSFVSLHLIGKDEHNSYSYELKKFIKVKGLEERVFFYGEQDHPYTLLKQADLGVLSSSSEGLPVALLEYGQEGLPVVCTEVGQCKDVVGDDGLVVPSGNPVVLTQAMAFYLENEDKRIQDAINFNSRVKALFTESAIIPEVQKFYSKIIQGK